MKRGNPALRACGTRFVAHKTAAIARVIDRFGAYLSHLITLTEDTTLKAVDHQKLKGCVLSWQESKVLLACAFFHDLLKPAAILCKILQENELCVMRVIEVIMKSKEAPEKLRSPPFEELTTVKKVLGQIKEEEGSVTYQGQDLKKHKKGLTFLKSHYVQWIADVKACL